MENTRKETGTAEDKIDLEYWHHLFLLPIVEKILKTFTLFPYFQKYFPN